MLQGIYDNAAALSTLERWQETISRNLAAGPAAGYRKEAFAVEGVRAGKLQADRGAMPRMVTQTSFTPGELRETGKATDMAVHGPGFFQVKGPDGQPAYTRDGEFQLNAEGALVTKRGWEVAGEGGSIVLNPESGPATVGPDGTVSQGETILGKLPLFEFANPGALQRREGGFFVAPEGVTPTPVAKPAILQGFTESGNSSPLSEMVGLVAVARAYEASQRVISSQDDLLHQAIQALGNPAA